MKILTKIFQAWLEMNKFLEGKLSYEVISEDENNSRKNKTKKNCYRYNMHINSCNISINAYDEKKYRYLFS